MKFGFFCCRRKSPIKNVETLPRFISELLGDKERLLSLEGYIYFQTKIITALDRGAIHQAQAAYARLFPGDEQGFLRISTTYLQAYKDLILFKIYSRFSDLRDYLLNGILEHPATGIHLLQVDSMIFSALQTKDAAAASIHFHQIFGQAGFNLAELCGVFGEYNDVFAQPVAKISP